MSKFKVAVGGAMAGVFLVLMAGMAAAVDASPETVVGDAASSLKSSLLAVAVAVLPYAAVLVAVSIGWRFARRALRF